VPLGRAGCRNMKYNHILNTILNGLFNQHKMINIDERIDYGES
jgi:hypothetical protein